MPTNFGAYGGVGVLDAGVVLCGLNSQLDIVAAGCWKGRAVCQVGVYEEMGWKGT